MAWLLIALAIVGLVFAAYMLMKGRPLVKFGILKRISTTRAVRMLGLALLIDSLAAVLIARFLHLLSQHLEPPVWSMLVFFPWW